MSDTEKRYSQTEKDPMGEEQIQNLSSGSSKIQDYYSTQTPHTNVQ